MLERTRNESMRMPQLVSTARCTCCGSSFERDDDNDLCLGCHEASLGQGAPGPIIPQTFGQRAVTGVLALAVVAICLLRLFAMFAHP